MVLWQLDRIRLGGTLGFFLDEDFGEVTPSFDEGFEVCFCGVWDLVKRQFFVTFLSVGCQGAGIEAIGFCFCSTGSDEVFDVSCIGPMDGIPFIDEGMEDFFFVSACGLEDDEGLFGCVISDEGGDSIG